MNLGTLIATLTVETAGLKRGVIDFGMLEKKILTASNKMVRQLGTLSAAVKKVERNIATMATSSAMSVWEKKMLAATNKMVRQLGRLTNQTRILKKEMLALSTASGRAGAMMGGMTGGLTARGGGMGMMPVISPGYAAGSVVDLTNMGNKLGKSWGNTLGQLSMQLRSFGWLATTVFTFPIVAGGAAVTKLGRDYEMAMAKIQGLVGINKRMVDDWNKALLKMPKAVAIGPMELADALYYVSSSGFKTQQALEITEMSAKGAATGLGETKDVANFLTSAMNAYRASGLTAAHAMDILTASVREGKGEPADMSRALGTILPIAAELGVSLDQVGGALASMTLITSQTANAATYLRNVFMKLIHPSAGTEKALKRMGTSVGELQDMLRNKGLMPTLTKIRELTDQYGESVADIFPNIRGLLGVLNLTGQNMKYNEGVMQEVTQSMGDFEKAFFIASGTVAFKWNAAVAGMKAGFVELGVAVARVVLPIMETWIARIQVVVKWFNELNSGTQRLVVRFAAFLAAIGPVSLLLAPIGMIIGGITKRVKELGGMLIWLGRMMIAIPWLAAITAALALGVAIYKLVKSRKEEENINKRVNATVEIEASKLKYLFGVIMDVNEGAERRIEAIRAANEGYSEYLPNVISEIDSMEDLAKAYEEADLKLRMYIATKERQAEVDKLNEKVGAKYAKNLGQYSEAALKYLHPLEVVEFTKALDTALMQSSEHLKNARVDAFALYKSRLTLQEFYDTWVKGLHDQAKAEGDNARARQLTWRQFEAEARMYGMLKSRTDPIIEGQEELIEKGKEVVKTIDDSRKVLNSFFETFKDDSIKEMLYNMEAAEKQMVLWDTYMVNAGQESTLAAEKLDLYNNMLRELREIGSADASKAYDYVMAKMKALQGTTKDLVEETETLDKIMADYAAEKKFTDIIQAHRGELEEFGKTFDYVEEQAKNYQQYIQRLFKAGFEDEIDTKRLMAEFEALPDSIQPVVEELLKLSEGLELVRRRSQFEGPKFDVMAAQISVYESAINGVLEKIIRMGKIEGMTVPVKVDGIEVAVPAVEYFNGLLLDMYDELDHLKEAQQAAIDQEMITLLTEEANAFGGLTGKIEVLNYTLDAAEKRLRSLLKKKLTGSNVQEDIEETVGYIRQLKIAIDEMNQAIEIQYLRDMYSAMNNLSAASALLDGYIQNLGLRLEQLSADGFGASEEFIALSKELLRIQRTIFAIDKVSDAMGGLVRIIMDGSDETESLGKKIGDYLINVLKDLVAELVTTIVKFTLLKGLMEGIGKTQGTLGEALLGILGKSLLGGLSGIVLSGETEFDTSGVDALNEALCSLSENAEKYNAVIATLLASQTVVNDTLKSGSEVIGANTGKMEALTKIKGMDLDISDRLLKANEEKISFEEAFQLATKTSTAVSAASVPVKVASGKASFFEGVGNFFKSVAALPPPLNIITMIAMVGAVTAAIISLVGAARGAKMAKGGIVPGGYPNDTFSALLTSGEAVIPLDRIEKQSLSLGDAEVRFEIEGDRLVGILKKQMKKTSIY